MEKAKLTYDELTERLCWSLAQKIDHSLGTIEDFISKTGGKVYLSYSGGKDSSVLLYLCRMIDKNIPIVFFNTGMEFPEVIQHVRSLKEEGYPIEIRKPSLKPSEIWEIYGFPLISKEQAHKLWYMKNKPESKTAQIGYCEKSIHNVSKCWRWLVDEEFSCNSKCCDILKKYPSHRYTKETGRYPIVGTTVAESLLRRQQYIRRGQCNSFAKRNIFSAPLSIWTEDDVWQFINDRNIKLPSVYYTGVKRTGCVLCGFGAHMDANRYDFLYREHKHLYDHIMNYTNNGVTFREAIRKVLASRGIELPDEKEPNLESYVDDC